MSSSHSQSGIPPPKSTHSFWHTQPSPLLKGHRSTRDLPGEADVVIIGSGITGASTAWHLLSPEVKDEGQDPPALHVVMLEAREACWGATGRNGGHCQPILFEHPQDPSIGEFELKNFDHIHSLVQKLGNPCEFVVQPGCRAIYSQHHLNEVETALRALETVAPHQRRRMTLVTDKTKLSQLRIPTAKAAVVTDIAARLWPYKFVASLLEKLVSAHTLRNNSTFNLQTLTPAESLTPHSSSQQWSIKTPRGTIITKKVILATNAYTSHLLPTFTHLIVPCRGQMSALLPTPSISTDHRLKTSLGFLGDGMDDYLIQRPSESGGHLMFGGGRHEGEHCIGTFDDTVIDAETATYLRTRLVEALALNHPEDGKHRGLLEGLLHGHVKELKAVAEWTGIMGYSRDEHPWVGPVPSEYAPGGHGEGKEGHRPKWVRGRGSGVYVAAGYTGHGMPNTWLCGKAVGMMVADSLGEGERDEEEVIEGVRKVTGLPKCYLVSDERMRRALDMESVEAKDLIERQRGKDSR